MGGGSLKSIGLDYSFWNKTKTGDPQICGSCSTLITEILLKYGDLLARDDGAVAVALQGVLLIDNHNFDEEANKATYRDVASNKVLAEHVKKSSRLCHEDNCTQEKWYEAIQDIMDENKYDVYMVLSNAVLVDGTTKRGVLCFSNDVTVTTKLAKHFQDGKNNYELVENTMHLPNVPDNKSGTVIAFDQKDITKSRKQYRPDMVHFLNKL